MINYQYDPNTSVDAAGYEYGTKCRYKPATLFVSQPSASRSKNNAALDAHKFIMMSGDSRYFDSRRKGMLQQVW